MSTQVEATVEDLYRVPDRGKAELVNGEIVLMPPTGDMPSRAGSSVYVTLRAHEGKTPGRAYADNAGFLVHLPNRRSFSPDAAWYIGPSTGMKFLQGTPVFAVEVRSEDDYGRSAERAMAQKRADYFAAGTVIVWDVDLLSPDVVKSYNAADPDTPKIFVRGEVADAEPAVPGWKLPVDELFS